METWTQQEGIWNLRSRSSRNLKPSCITLLSLQMNNKGLSQKGWTSFSTFVRKYNCFLIMSIKGSINLYFWSMLLPLGPVCVVSIAGPYRKGKSYILSKLFDGGEVFPLGRYMDPETMGIWMWIVPEKIKVRAVTFLVLWLPAREARE